MSEVGHNSVAKDVLKEIVDRVENLEDEKSNIALDIREVYTEAKGRGLDPKIIRKVIALRKKDASEREEEAAMLDLYMSALNMLPEDVEALKAMN